MQEEVNSISYTSETLEEICITSGQSAIPSWPFWGNKTPTQDRLVLKLNKKKTLGSDNNMSIQISFSMKKGGGKGQRLLDKPQPKLLSDCNLITKQQWSAPSPNFSWRWLLVSRPAHHPLTPLLVHGPAGSPQQGRQKWHPNCEANYQQWWWPEALHSPRGQPCLCLRILECASTLSLLKTFNNA